MAEDLMRYDLMAQDALRGVVKAAMKRAAKVGLPGDHHFFVSFDTNHSGVRISERLRKKYPDEMTIVLQHQFWSLDVYEDRFEVDLSFDNIPERLSVPFVAVKGFFDPAVQFGLQFEVSLIEEGEGSTEESNPAAPPAAGAKIASIASLPQSTPKIPVGDTSDEVESVKTGSGKSAGKPALTKVDDADPNETKVVKLDTFRKK